MDLFGFHGFLGPEVKDGITRAWGPTNKQSTCPCKVGKKAGSEVPRWISYRFHRFSKILIDLYGFHGFLRPEVRDGIRRPLGPTNKQSTCPCKVGKKAGYQVPRWMTGSAGTAMDVLVT